MKLKVGLFNDSFPPTIDGVANCVLNYAKIITKNHGECCVVTPKYPNVQDNYDFEVYRYFSVPMEQLLGYRVGDPFSPFTIKEIRDKKFDIIHVHAPFASSVLAKQVTSGKKHVPVVLTYHTKFDIDLKKLIKVKPFREVVKWFIVKNINSADEVWVVSNGAAKSLRELGYTGEYIVMPNGTDFSKGKATEDQINEIEQKFGIEKDDLVFLFVGRMMWYKNVKLIIDSLEIVRNKGLKFKMIFVGDGKDKSDIEKYVNKLKLNDITYFSGPVRDREVVRTYFSRANLFLFPSTYDTSGLVVKEAAACDCPSVLVKDSCAGEGVEDGYSGFLCEETPEDCARTILEAASDRDKLKEIGENAGKYVYLSWEDAVDKAYERYHTVIENFNKTKEMKKEEKINE